MLAQWLDAHLGPPWSGLVMLALIAVVVALSGYGAVRIVRHLYSDGDDGY